MKSLESLKVVFEQIIQLNQDGLCILDADGRIAQINDQFANVLGRTQVELIGQNIENTCLVQLFQQVTMSNQKAVAAIRGNASGESVSVTLVPIFLDDILAGVVAYVDGDVIVRELTESLKVAQQKAVYLEQKLKIDQETRWHPDRYIGETLEQKLVRTLKPGSAFDAFIGLSPKVLEALAIAGKAAQAQSTVLICGKSGTGKELIAAGIHKASPRCHGPFIKINCAAIPATLLESELFGHEKGAFTGAIKKKLGKFELADQGTIFLDEIGEMDLSMQSKLLRVLQDCTFERVGAEGSIKVSVRVVAATNRNLEQMVKAGQFREDLYYRLSVIPIYLPPLNERKEDIPLLVDYFLKYFNQQLGKQIKGISQAAMDALIHYEWPGNVRELKNIIERIAVLTDEIYIDLCDLPSCCHYSKNCDSEEVKIYGSIVREKIFPLEQYEKQIIKAALEKHGSYTAAAKALGITHKTVAAKAQKYGLMDWINRWTLF